jgi:tRNA-dihydrouridine synthase B
MISAKGFYYNDKATERLLQYYEEEQPLAYQIFGSEPEIIAYTSKALSERENVLLDINMGCPVPKVVKNGEGSALLKTPHQAATLIRAAVENTHKPVTAKIRIGWDENSVNAVEVAKAIEAAGASAIAVHGRTRQQFYSGKADWSMINKVKKAVNIPVIGNGDVFSGEDALRLMEETQCDFVMIARGALGNPWIFREALALWKGMQPPPGPTIEEKVSTMIKHLKMLVADKGEHVAVREMRKHVGWYIKGMKGSAEIRRKVNTIDNVELLIQTIKGLLLTT